MELFPVTKACQEMLQAFDVDAKEEAGVNRVEAALQRRDKEAKDDLDLKRATSRAPLGSTASCDLHVPSPATATTTITASWLVTMAFRISDGL
jgi:hypothetical protein